MVCGFCLTGCCLWIAWVLGCCLLCFVFDLFWFVCLFPCGFVDVVALLGFGLRINVAVAMGG